jgi:hypothetical protein
MAMYRLNLMRIAWSCAAQPVYEDIATKFFEHFLHIAEAMTHMGAAVGLWDEEDQFFYDVLTLPWNRKLPLEGGARWSGSFRCSRSRCLEPELPRPASGVHKAPEVVPRLQARAAALVSTLGDARGMASAAASLLRGTA